MESLGFDLIESATLESLILDVVDTSRIEGEFLNPELVRSSIARRLGVENADFVKTPRNIDGIVDVILDATQNFEKPLTEERLLGWHNSLFQSGFSGYVQIDVAKYRSGGMKVVSGNFGKEKVHFVAPTADRILVEMQQFLKWLNEETKLDLVIKSMIAHFWFVTIHPFDDGNGRIARAISDLMLGRADKTTERYYSMSSQILIERKKYFEILQKVQHSRGDLTDWLEWFLHCLQNSLLATDMSLQKILRKTEFWKVHENTIFNERQRFVLNKMFDGFEGKLKSSKWAKIAKCSPDSALRDIKDLIDKGILRQEQQGGRSTNYELAEF
jgi:Fic family protein